VLISTLSSYIISSKSVSGDQLTGCCHWQKQKTALQSAISTNHFHFRPCGKGAIAWRPARAVKVSRGRASGGGAWGRAGFLLAGTGGDFNVPSRTSALVCLTNTQEVIHAETVQIGMAKKYP